MLLLVNMYQVIEMMFHQSIRIVDSKSQAQLSTRIHSLFQQLSLTKHLRVMSPTCQQIVQDGKRMMTDYSLIEEDLIPYQLLLREKSQMEKLSSQLILTITPKPNLSLMYKIKLDLIQPHHQQLRLRKCLITVKF